MIKSMYSAVTGLRGHQTMLDVIGNNIANVNTVGFKSSRVLFTDLFYQTLSEASAPTATSGGQSPTQIGYGSAIASIDLQASRSGFQQTARTMDLYISGEGYFIVEDQSGQQLYTRVGSLKFNSEGMLIDSNGNFVLGGIPEVGRYSLETLEIRNFDRYTGLYIDESGYIKGTNTVTKQIDSLGQVALATFANPEALSQEGNMYYAETDASGTPNISKPGTTVTGPLVSGGLEMSNVDLTREFTDMIIAQRGFQANSRVITTSDQVLEELVNLKR
jgi:flagellar hook protein FlgE